MKEGEFSGRSNRMCEYIICFYVANIRTTTASQGKCDISNFGWPGPFSHDVVFCFVSNKGREIKLQKKEKETERERELCEGLILI